MRNFRPYAFNRGNIRSETSTVCLNVLLAKRIIMFVGSSCFCETNTWFACHCQAVEIPVLLYRSDHVVKKELKIPVQRMVHSWEL